MKFWLAKSPNIMGIDNANALLDLSALTFDYVTWDGISGLTQAIDAPGIRIPFTDPVPYKTYINAWITAAAAMTPALSLVQAKQIKLDYIDTLFNVKRQAPYSLFSQSWDATDEELSAMTQVLAINANAVVPSLVGPTNSAFSTLIAQINGALASLASTANTQLNTTVGELITIASILNSNVGSINAWTSNGSVLDSQLTFASAGAYANGLVSVSEGTITAPSSRSIVSSPIDGTSAAASDLGNVSWPVAGSPTTLTLTFVQFYSIASGIVARRSALQVIQRTKRAAVNALTTIPAVAALDVTTGW